MSRVQLGIRYGKDLKNVIQQENLIGVGSLGTFPNCKFKLGISLVERSRAILKTNLRPNCSKVKVKFTKFAVEEQSRALHNYHNLKKGDVCIDRVELRCVF